MVRTGQRDAVERTLLGAAVNGRHPALADRLVVERLALRPTSRFALDRRARRTQLG